MNWRMTGGLVTNSIIFCWLLTIKDRCKKCDFNKRTIEVCVSCSWWCPWTSALWFALQANQWFFTKRKQNKIELVARPGKEVLRQLQRLTRNLWVFQARWQALGLLLWWPTRGRLRGWCWSLARGPPWCLPSAQERQWRPPTVTTPHTLKHFKTGTK